MIVLTDEDRYQVAEADLRRGHPGGGGGHLAVHGVAGCLSPTPLEVLTAVFVVVPADADVAPGRWAVEPVGFNDTCGPGGRIATVKPTGIAYTHRFAGPWGPKSV